MTNEQCGVLVPRKIQITKKPHSLLQNNISMISSKKPQIQKSLLSSGQLSLTTTPYLYAYSGTLNDLQGKLSNRIAVISWQCN